MVKKRISIKGIPAVLWGEDSNELFVAVHGNLSSKEDVTISILAEEVVPLGYQVLSFDLPEHGNRKKEPTLCKVEPCVLNLKEVFKFASTRAESISLWANSIGVYFSLLAYQEEELKQCLFLSPVVDMGRLIQNMMKWFAVSKEQLEKEKEVSPPIGQTLYWDYYQYVMNNPIVKWNAPTRLLYGKKDEMTEYETLSSFQNRFPCTLTVSDTSEHYFHTEEDLSVYRQWLQKSILK